MRCAVDNHNYVSRMCKGTLDSNMTEAGFLWQNINFSRNRPKFHILIKIVILKVQLKRDKPTASTF